MQWVTGAMASVRRDDFWRGALDLFHASATRDFRIAEQSQRRHRRQQQQQQLPVMLEHCEPIFQLLPAGARRYRVTSHVAHPRRVVLSSHIGPRRASRTRCLNEKSTRFVTLHY